MPSVDETFPTEPKTFGEELRRLREGAGVSLQEVAAETKVSARILEALESGKFQYLPEPVFTRNFVRQYARVIGFDTDRIVAWFDTAWEHFNLASGAYEVLGSPEPAPRHSFRWRFWLPMALAGVILVAVAIVVWQARSGPPSGSAPISSRATATLAPTVPALPPTSAPTVAPSPSPVAPAPASDKLAVDVSIAEGRECWIRYRDGEGRTEQRLLLGGADAHFELPAPVLLTLGSAGVATVTVNGRPYRDLGQPGQVVHLELTTQGTQVLGGASAAG